MKTKIRRVWYRAKHDILTLNNIVIFVAAVICVNWVWMSISTMHRNYDLQKKVDDMHRQALILELETLTLEYESNYYKTDEYKELAARDKLGLAREGERLLILPKNSEAATNKYKKSDVAVAEEIVEDESNFYQWMKFLFGANQRE